MPGWSGQAEHGFRKEEQSQSGDSIDQTPPRPTTVHGWTRAGRPAGTTQRHGLTPGKISLGQEMLRRVQARSGEQSLLLWPSGALNGKNTGRRLAEATSDDDSRVLATLNEDERHYTKGLYVHLLPRTLSHTAAMPSPK